MTVRRVLLVPDGMADEPQEALGGRTPLESAATPAMDELARRGVVGLVQTVPDGMPPGSDVANLAVLGYDPAAVFSGRSPLEAANIGVELGPGDVAYRCNFVTVVDAFVTTLVVWPLWSFSVMVEPSIALIVPKAPGAPAPFAPGGAPPKLPLKLPLPGAPLL